MLRVAAEADVSAMLSIYRPYVLTSTATFEYDPPSRASKPMLPTSLDSFWSLSPTVWTAWG